jgi:hypothetical protein
VLHEGDDDAQHLLERGPLPPCAMPSARLRVRRRGRAGDEVGGGSSISSIDGR